MSPDYPPVMRFRAVFFDVGETLVHVDPSFADLFVTVLAGAGHIRSVDEVRNASAHVYTRFSEAARDGSMWTTTPERSRTFWTSVYERMLGELGVADGDGLAATLHREFTRLENYVLFDDVRPTLASLREAGLLLGIVSNFEAWLEDWFGVHELLETFPVRVISGIEGIEKPDERIFRLALERASVSPRRNPPTWATIRSSTWILRRRSGCSPSSIDRRDRFPDHDGTRVTDLRELPAILGAAA